MSQIHRQVKSETVHARAVRPRILHVALQPGAAGLVGQAASRMSSALRAMAEMCVAEPGTPYGDPLFAERGERAIEDGFPVEAVSEVAEVESWRKEIYRPVYHVHKVAGSAPGFRLPRRHARGRGPKGFGGHGAVLRACAPAGRRGFRPVHGERTGATGNASPGRALRLLDLNGYDAVGVLRQIVRVRSAALVRSVQAHIRRDQRAAGSGAGKPAQDGEHLSGKVLIERVALGVALVTKLERERVPASPKNCRRSVMKAIVGRSGALFSICEHAARKTRPL